MRRTPNSGRITLADVARESGFSSSTVSIVLNEAPLSRYVAAKTKLLIKETSKRLGYRPDAFARSLRRRRSLTIGIMVFDISDPFCTLILKGIQKTLQPTGYLPIIMDAYNEPKQFERYLEMMLERRLEALIIVANWLFVDIEMFGDLERERIPMVMVGRSMSIGSMSSVMVDNEAGGYAELQHLYKLGHRKNRIRARPGEVGGQQPTLQWHDAICEGSRAEDQSFACCRSPKCFGSTLKLSSGATDLPKSCWRQANNFRRSRPSMT